MTIKVVAFDLDDTLWPLKPVMLRAEAALTNHLRRRHGITWSREGLAPLRERVLRREPGLAGMVGRFRLQVLRELLLEAGRDAATAELHAREAFAVFLEERNQVSFYEGALEALAELKRHYRLGSLSNGNADITLIGLSDFFSFSFSAEDVGAPKPEPALFHAALKATGAQASEMVYVGDDPERDVRAAAAAGLRTVWVNHNRVGFGGSRPADGSVEELRELPEVVRSLA